MSERDDEVCRMLLRKRAKLWVGERDPFRGYDTPLYCEGRDYYLADRTYRSWDTLYVVDGRQTVYLDVAAHLLDTLWGVVRERLESQDAARKSRIVSSILRAPEASGT